MLRLHPQTRALPALLLLASMICGCKAEEEGGPSPQLCGRRLQSGEPIDVRMWGELCDCTYQGTAGETIQISVSRTMAPGLDPYVRLLDPSGAEEAFDDDSGSNGDALIQGHVLRSSGIYTVSIGTDENRTGELSVVLLSTAPPGPQPVPDAPATTTPVEDPKNGSSHEP